MFYQGEYDSETKLTFDNENENYTNFNFSLYRADNKLRFKSNKQFIFTHNFYDSTDEMKNISDRAVLNKLTILEVSDKNDKENKVNIKFNPNYKHSSTRYIIIIAPKNKNNNIETFNDPCYIGQLLKNKIGRAHV